MRDLDVRSALRFSLRSSYSNDPSTVIVEEMGVWSGSVRVDIAVINGELVGFELKSDRDTLDRLPLQSELYSKVFDKVVLVCGSRHTEKAVALIPEWWGVIVASETTSGIVLNPSRGPHKNPSPDPYLVAQLLWKDEAIAVLDTRGLAKGWRSKKVKQIHQRLATELPFETLSADVRSMLKCRTNWLRQDASRQLDVPIDANLNPAL